ncbi:hypothetical protein ABK040_009842 [Willaertia magna]
MSSNRFLLRNKENENFNQYWYSSHTIDVIVKVIEDHLKEEPNNRVAFLSTPSLYFSLSSPNPNANLFEFDTKWSKDKGFVLFDFNQPECFDENLSHQFTMVVVDPPFITREVWEKYAKAILKLRKDENTKIICSTIAENADMMKELLNLTSTVFQPSIPHLVYQYNLYTNFHNSLFNEINSELG